MPRLLYFVPARKVVAARHLAELGLAYIRDGEGPTRGELRGGPDGHSGAVLTCQRGATLSGVEDATWSKLRGVTTRKGEELLAYVGHVESDGKPGPRELARKVTHAGHEVELADGNLWTVPVARALNGTTPLPRSLGYDGAGWSEGEVVELYRDLWGEACWFWGAITSVAEEGSGAADFELSRMYSIACAALAVNYTLGPNEIAHLGLFTTDTARDVALALIDWPALEALKKKEAPEPQPSTPGAED